MKQNRYRVFKTSLDLSLLAVLTLVSPIDAANCVAPEPNQTNDPVTIAPESSVLPDSRSLSNGTSANVDTATPGKVRLNVSGWTAPAPLTVTVYSAGGAYTPAENSFSTVTNATQINLPTVLSGAKQIWLTIGGSLTSVSVVAASGDDITFNGASGASSTSMTLRNGDQICFTRLASSSTWAVSTFVPRGSGGSLWSAVQGGLGFVPVITKGDLIVGSSAWSQLTPGTLNQALVADSGSVSGMRWSSQAVQSAGNYFGTGTDGDAVVSTSLQVGNATQDGVPVVMNYNSLHITGTGSLTTQVRKQALLIYVKGDLIVDSGGVIHMNSKGGVGTPAGTVVLPKLTNIFDQNDTFASEANQVISAYTNGAFSSVNPGGSGGAAPTTGQPGNDGGAISSGTGGGGSGGASGSRLGAAGAAGTAWCGGSGGGGAGGAAAATASGGASPTAAATGGGAGGNGGQGQDNSTTSANGVRQAAGGGGGGGAGNSPGTGGLGGFNPNSSFRQLSGSTPTGGGGGTLFVVVGGSVVNNGVISANGADGGAGGDSAYVTANSNRYFLGSTTKNLVQNLSVNPVHITENGAGKNITYGSTVTPGEYLAVQQVLQTGNQSCTLNASGAITSGLGSGGGGGGGAGGGRLILLYAGTFTGNEPVAAGGQGGLGSIGQNAGQQGGAGGNGSVTRQQIFGTPLN